MRIAVMSDIHGYNLAFATVLADIASCIETVDVLSAL